MPRLNSPASRWNGHSDPPAIAVQTRYARGAEFQEVRYGPEGAWDLGTTGLHVAALVTPAHHRGASAGSPWRPMTPSTAVALPGDLLVGGWRGRMLGRHLFLSRGVVEEMLDAPFHPDGIARRGFAEASDAPPRARVADQILHALALDLGDGSPSGPAFGQAAIAALLRHLRPPAPRAAAAGPRRRGLSERQLARVLEVIEEELTGRPDLRHLAEAAGVSVPHLCRRFRESTGTSPHRFVLRRRVERARALLARPEVGFSEVAEAVGFADHSQMATTFRRLLGAPPSHFRNIARQASGGASGSDNGIGGENGAAPDAD